MNQENEEQSGHGGLVWIALIVLLPVLYVLSIGPVAASFKMMGNPPPSYLMQFYVPVIWLHEHTPLKKPLEAYVKLWGVP